MSARGQRDMDSAYLAGKTRFEKWRKGYELETTREDREMLMSMTAQSLLGLPPEAQAFYQENFPREWKAVQKMAQVPKRS